MTGDSDIQKPSAVLTIVNEVQPEDVSAWEPNSFAEWEAKERLRAYLRVWSQQMDDERKMRSLYAKMIFILISSEVLFAFLLIGLLGSRILILDVSLLKILFPSVLAQIFGLGYLVTRYLFGKQLSLPLSEVSKSKLTTRVK